MKSIVGAPTIVAVCLSLPNMMLWKSYYGGSQKFNSHAGTIVYQETTLLPYAIASPSTSVPALSKHYQKTGGSFPHKCKY